MPGTFIDIHAHILPEVDDGAPDWKISKAMMWEAYQQGVCCIIATPHYRKGQDKLGIQQKAEELNEAASKLCPGMEIKLGQEVMYFEDLSEYLKGGEVFTLAESRYVLVEFMPSDPCSRLLRAVRQLVQSGYLPVIAHWERYGCLYEPGRLEELIQCGAFIQTNCGSIRGRWGSSRAGWRRKQILEGKVHFLGSDMHDLHNRPPGMEKAAAWLDAHGQGLLEKITQINPQHILDDRLLQLE